MLLIELVIRKAKSSDKPVKLSDGKGLYLLVHPNGSKYWPMKYRFNGQEQILSIGIYPEVLLLEAREILEDARKLLKEGINPHLGKGQIHQ